MSEPILCPACGEEISTEATLWTLMGRWYCSEKCARKGLAAHHARQP